MLLPSPFASDAPSAPFARPALIPPPSSAMTATATARMRLHISTSHQQLHSSGFASPPASPPSIPTAPDAAGSSRILATSRSLHSLLGTATSPVPPVPTTPDKQPLQQQLPTPPLAHATIVTPPLPPSTPLKLRLRQRPRTTVPDSAPLGLIGDSNNSVVKRKRIVKRAGIGSLSTVAAAATARETKRVANAGNSSNKRRRDWDDEENAEPEYMARRGQQQQQHTLHGCANTGSMEKDGDVESDLDLGMSATEDGERQQEPPRTPPRHRISPLAMPLGLERADYHSVPEYAPSASMSATSSSRAQAPEHQRGQSLDAQRQESKDGSADVWTSADDRLLVELVLEKLHLTRDEWADCARSLGRDRGSVGRRWRSLVAAGEIGVLFSSSSPSGSGNGASRVRARGMGVQRGRICSTWR